MKKLRLVIALLMLSAATFILTCRVFDSRFADITIDYFAFFAGIFLFSEGTFSLLRSPFQTPFDILSRGLRVIIGVCVFTIHLLQFMRY